MLINLTILIKWTNSLKYTNYPQSIIGLEIPKSIREIEFVVKNILTEKIPIPNDFIGDYFQKTKENIFQLIL